MRTIIKTDGNLILYKYSELKYRKNGRANMHMQITYGLELNEEYLGELYTDKAKAIKAFNAEKLVQLKKNLDSKDFEQAVQDFINNKQTVTN